MNGSCNFPADMGAVRNMLAAVDCNTQHFATLGYGSLTASALFQTALTVCLTIYVALIGYKLLFAPDGVRLSDGPVMALKVGATVALVTSWGLFQTLVFNVADRAPFEIANLIANPVQSNSSLAADPIEGTQTAYDQLSQAASALGTDVGTGAQHFANQKSAAAELLSVAAGVLLFGCTGLLAVGMVVIGVLTVVGPLFLVLLLFFETRGFFVGWIRALSATAFGIVSSWTLIVLMLYVSEPWLSELAVQREAAALDVQTATTTAAIVFVFAACQLVMVLAAVIIASGFSIAPRHRRERVERAYSPDGRHRPNEIPGNSRPVWLAEQLRRPRAAPLPEECGALVATSAFVQSRPLSQGDLLVRHHYRRPMVSAHDRARAEAAE